MSTLNKILLFFLLPAVGTLVFPPSSYENQAGLVLIAIVIAMFIGIGVLLLRGNSSALTFAIFIQGLNVIVRLMMVFPGAVSKDLKVDPPYIIAMVVGIIISTYLMLRLDQSDIRRTMRT